LSGSGPVLHEQVLAPLSEGRSGSYRRYDWHREEHAESRAVPVTDVLVVEGVGSWRREHAGLVTVLVWVEAPAAVRLERAVRRDGAHLAPHLLRWQRDEDRLHAAEATRDQADVVVTDGAAR
jgi:uridine kinase